MAWNNETQRLDYLDPETTSLNDLLIDLGSRCHEGVQLSGGYGKDDWTAEVCSKSSRELNADSKNKDAYFDGPGFATPIEAVKALYYVYVNKDGTGAC